MKRLFLYQILGILITTAILFGACTKENAGVKLPARVVTSQFLNVKSDSVTVVGFVVAQGEGVTEKGVCYGTTAAPTIANSKVIFSGPTTGATYNIKIGGLAYATTYYARAYATSAEGTVYGEQVTFNTLPVVPTLTTAAVTAITGNAAVSGGAVTVTGGATVTARGVCIATTHNPVVSGTKTSDGNGAGAFVSTLASLSGNTTYYVRAYATNSAGTGYGPEATFKTLVDLPVVTTTAVTAVTKTTAVSGGAVSYDGGGTIIARGLAWGTTANPTTVGSMIDGGTGTGAFVSNLPALTVFTTYHVRAYATNSAGTAYGADVSFTTLADITKFWIVGGYNGWDNSDNALFIINTPATGANAEGYVNFTAAGEFKLATNHSWDDAHTFGDDGTNTGKLSNVGGGHNIAVPSAGYYLIKANQTTMTYTLTKTTWGIMGDYNGWASQTDLVYNPTPLNFSLALHLTAGGGYKFRGTSDWSLNFGNTAGDGKTLDYGAGSNISVNATADYAITLDLSHPNVYTYSTNRWSLIGDFNSWGADADMTWDATNHVFTATVTAAASGSWKFRANHDWPINFGGALNALAQDGSNLSFASSGSYTVTLDPWTRVATVTKN